MKSIITLLLLSLSAINASAQGLELAWVDGFKDDALSEGHSLVIDNENNVYVLGYTSGVGALLDVNPDTTIENELTARGVFLAKYDVLGNYLWSVSLGQTGSFGLNIHGGIALNENGDLLVAGILSGDIDFDPSGETELASYPDGMIYLASYSSEGELNFVKVFPFIVQGLVGIKGIDVNAEGEIYFAGSIMNNGAPIASVDFDPSENSALLTNDTGNSFFIVKYSPLGDLLFLKILPGSAANSSNRLQDLKLNSSGDFWITGEITKEWDMDPSPLNFPLNTNSGRGVFFAKYNSEGELIDAKFILSGGIMYSRSIALDIDDNIYLSGEFTGNVDFNPNEEEFILSAVTNREPYLAKYSTDGNLIFAFELNSDSTVAGTNATRCLTTDKLGYVYIAGKIESACDFDPSDNEFILAPQNENVDLLYIAKYDEEGNFIWAIGYAETTFGFNLDIEVNNSGVVTTTGLYRSNVDFDPGENNSNTLGNGSNTMFIARFQPCNYSGDFASICQGDTFQASTRSLSQEGVYQISYLSALGCDSIVTLNLMVNELPNNSIYMDEFNALSCSQSGANYQWIDCETNELILGATQQSFLPITAEGIYSAQISLNGCSSNSECVSLQSVSINNISASTILVYPNPANSNVIVKCKAGSIIELVNIHGQLIHSQKAISTITEISKLPESGMYFIRISDEKQGSTTQKLIIQ